MKKLLVLFTLIGSALTVSADDYSYLYFRNTDGTGQLGNITAKGTTITFSDGNLIAVNTTTSESLTIALSDLGAMSFSGESTGISSATLTEDMNLDNADAIYDLTGRRVSRSTELKKGIYILRKDGQTKKIQIK